MGTEKRFKIVVDSLIDMGKIGSYKHLSDIIGESRQGLYDIKSGKKNLSLSIVSKMKKAFPAINVDYLVLGEGEPLETAYLNNSPLSIVSESGNCGNCYQLEKEVYRQKGIIEHLEGLIERFFNDKNKSQSKSA